ncbi:NADP-dependent oxidoreductase [Spirillospora sp. NBC_00431]
MRSAVVATAFGGPDALSTVKEPIPEPGRGEVTIQVRAAGVNPFDGLLYSGAFGDDESLLPMRLGQEFAGVVTATGPDATGPAGPVQVGDEVLVYSPGPLGAYATDVTCPADIVVPKPAALAWEKAAGLLFAGAAAVHALTSVAVSDGDTLLLHGAAGGVGSVATQLAILRGAQVIGVDRESRHEALRAQGALPVSYGPDFTSRVRELAPGGITAAIDAVGSDEAIDLSLELVPDRKRIATLVNFPRGNEAGINTLGAAGGAIDAGTEVRANAWTELVPKATDGSLDIVVSRTFPLAETAQAHKLMAAGQADGKIVLLP